VYCNVENPKKKLNSCHVCGLIWLICAKDKAKIEEMVEHMDKAFDITTRCALALYVRSYSFWMGSKV